VKSTLPDQATVGAKDHSPLHQASANRALWRFMKATKKILRGRQTPKDYLRHRQSRCLILVTTAGFLTRGSPYSPNLPAPFRWRCTASPGHPVPPRPRKQWPFSDFIPAHSAGPTWRIPTAFPFTPTAGHRR